MDKKPNTPPLNNQSSDLVQDLGSVNFTTIGDPVFTAAWSDNSHVNQINRTITGFLTLSEVMNSNAFIQRNLVLEVRSVRPNRDLDYTWTPASGNNWNAFWNLESSNTEKNWIFIISLSQTAQDANFDGVNVEGLGTDRVKIYRLVLKEDAFGPDKPLEDIISKEFELKNPSEVQNKSLYMVGSTNNAIYSLNPYTGIANRVKNLVDQKFPQDLQFIEPNMYMIGAAPPGLFSVDFFEFSRTQDEALRIGQVPENFGLSETIQAFTTSDTQIWLATNNDLYEVDPDSWTATKLSSLFMNRVDGLAYGKSKPNEDYKLYISGGCDEDTRKLYTIDPISGHLESDNRSSRSSLFGIRSMVFARYTLYALKRDTSGKFGIYEVDLNNGTANTKVGNNIDKFGVNETNPAGITSDRFNLYIIGGSNNTFYQIDITENSSDLGGAINIADLDLSSIGEPNTGPVFYYSGHFYMYGPTNKRIFNLHISDGSFTQVSINNLGIKSLILTGLTESNGQLYAVGILNDFGSFFEIDKVTGIAKQMGSTKNFGEVQQTLPTGILYVNNTWYMIGAKHNNQSRRAALYKLDRETGIAIRIGSESIINFGVNEYYPTGLAAINDKVYMVGGNTASLYELDLTTGTATRVNNNITGFGQQELAPQGLTYVEDKPRVSIGEPEEFQGVKAPNRVYGKIEPVVRKFPFYIDITWDRDIILGRDIPINFLSNSFSLTANIKNIGTENSFYQWRLEVTGTGTSKGSFVIQIPPITLAQAFKITLESPIENLLIGQITLQNITPLTRITSITRFTIGSTPTKEWVLHLDRALVNLTNGQISRSRLESGTNPMPIDGKDSPQTSKTINYDFDFPKYNSWDDLSDEIQTLPIISITVNTMNTQMTPKPEDFYLEGIVNNKPYKNSSRIISISEIGSSSKYNLKIQLPKKSAGFLRVIARSNTLLNQNGVLGPISEVSSPEFQFDTINFS